MNYNKLPADPLALILGIIALVLGIASCCCYGITAIVPLILAIIGLVVANKSLRLFGENPEAYDPQSRSNVNTARIINIIAVVINGLIFLCSIAVLAFYGTMLSSGMLEDFKNERYEDDDYYDYQEYDNDSLNTWEDDEDAYLIEEDRDSILIEESTKENN